MFIAMNRFWIAPGREPDFEAIWRDRDSYLHQVPGFIEFHLLRDGSDSGAVLYASHSVWESRQAFDDWTNSAALRKAQAEGRDPEATHFGPPQFEGFDVVI